MKVYVAWDMFTIGKIFTTQEAADNYLDEEARLEAIKANGKWTPALYCKLLIETEEYEVKG